LGVQRIWSPRLNQVVTWIIAPLLVLVGIRFLIRRHSRHSDR